MTTQPEALRLADWLISVGGGPLAKDAAAELRRLHAEVEEQCRLNGMGSEREARLMAENEALRADAERYRWLRTNKVRPIYRPGHPRIEHYIDGQTLAWSHGEQPYAEAIDAAIDAARSKT